MVAKVSDDEQNPVLTAMATMAEHGVTLDAARADSEAAHHGGGQFDHHEQMPAHPQPLSATQRRQVDQTSAALVRNLTPELQAMLAQVRSGQVSTADFEAEFRSTYDSPVETTGNRMSGQ
jgi:Spy/CpxP family protein refolding chaperone